MKYKLSLQLYKVNNEDWIDMNYQQNFNTRLDCVQIFDDANIRIGKKYLKKQT